MRDPNLVILVGGISSRMREAAGIPARIGRQASEDASYRPKSMIRVGGDDRPFLDYLLENARDADYRDTVIVVGESDSSIREHYADAGGGTGFSPMAISFAVQKIPPGRTKPCGTADALLQALIARPDWQGQKFTVCNSDNLYSQRALRLLLECEAESAVADYDREGLRFDEKRVSRFAVLRKNPDGSLCDIVEKPSAKEIALARDLNGRIGVSMNLFRLAYDKILPHLREVPVHPVRNEKELPEAVRLLARSNPGSVATIRLREHVPDLTSRNDIAVVTEFLRKAFRDRSRRRE